MFNNLLRFRSSLHLRTIPILKRGSPEEFLKPCQAPLLTPCQGLRSKFAYPEGLSSFEEDYAEVPEYPPLNPDTKNYSDKQREHFQETLDWETSIRNAPTVEEKGVLLNINRKYGWASRLLNDEIFEYDSQSIYNHVTRTFVVKGDVLPSYYDSPELNEKAKYFAEKVRGPLLDILKFELQEFRRASDDNMELYDEEKEKAFANTVVNQVNRILLAILSPEVDHLKTCQVDYDTNIEAFWHIGGMEQRHKEKERRKKREKNKDHLLVKPDSPVDRAFQYEGNPIIQIRSQDPLPNFLPDNHQLCLKSEEVLDRYPYLPEVYGIKKKLRYATIMPGHWSQDTYNGSLLAIHSSHTLSREDVKASKYYMDDAPEILNSLAGVTSFARLFTQAFYYGFDQYSGLNYPFSTQTILTNGINWSFFAYQLNTIDFYQRKIGKNKRQNILWGVKQQSILKGDLGDTSQLELNEETLRNLLLFYLNPPQPITTTNPTPYIKHPLKDMEDEVQREKIQFNLRMMHSQYRLETDPYPEIYNWEWIYKIKFKTRPMDARRRHFEVPDARPYFEKWRMLHPNHKGKGLRYLEGKIAEREEKERIEAIKKEKKSIRIKKSYVPEEYPGSSQGRDDSMDDDDPNTKNTKKD